MTAPLSVQVVPAQLGFFTVLDFEEEKEVALGDPIIAWRIETHTSSEEEGVFSVCIAITVDGDVASNCIGVQNPDKTVTVFDDTTYTSVDALQASRYPK